MKVIKCKYTKNGDTCVSKTLVYLNFYRLDNQEQPIKKELLPYLHNFPELSYFSTDQIPFLLLDFRFC